MGKRPSRSAGGRSRVRAEQGKDCALNLLLALRLGRERLGPGSQGAALPPFHPPGGGGSLRPCASLVSLPLVSLVGGLGSGVDGLVSVLLPTTPHMGLIQAPR